MDDDLEYTWQDVMINCFGSNWVKDNYTVIDIGEVAAYAANLRHEKYKFEIQEECENKLKQENKKLKDCVEFYGDKENYTLNLVCFHVEQTGIDEFGQAEWEQYQDGGGKARQCLKELEK